MKTIQSSGQRVPAIGIGCRNFRGGPDSKEIPVFRDTFETFHRLGGRVVDTSPNYGNSEEVIGRIMRELEIRDDLWLATKVDREDEASGVQRMDESFEKLGGDHFDLMQVHNLRGVEAQECAVAPAEEAAGEDRADAGADAARCVEETGGEAGGGGFGAEEGAEADLASDGEDHDEAAAGSPEALGEGEGEGAMLGEVADGAAQIAKEKDVGPVERRFGGRCRWEAQVIDEDGRDEVGRGVEEEDAGEANDAEEKASEGGAEGEHRAPGRGGEGVGGVEVLGRDGVRDGGGAGGVEEDADAHLGEEEGVEKREFARLIDEEEAEDDGGAQEVRDDHHGAAREAVGDGACDRAEEGGREQAQGELDGEERAEAGAEVGAAEVADQGQDRHAVEPVAGAGDDLGEPELAELGVLSEDAEHGADCSRLCQGARVLQSGAWTSRLRSMSTRSWMRRAFLWSWSGRSGSSPARHRVCCSRPNSSASSRLARSR